MPRNNAMQWCPKWAVGWVSTRLTVSLCNIDLLLKMEADIACSGRKTATRRIIPVVSHYACCLPGRVSATGNGRFCVEKWVQCSRPVHRGFCTNFIRRPEILQPLIHRIVHNLLPARRFGPPAAISSQQFLFESNSQGFKGQAVCTT